MISQANIVRCMKFRWSRIFLFPVIVTGVILCTGCPDNSDEEKQSQEQRYFDLYVASHYPDVEPRPNGIYFIEHKEGTGSFPDSDDWLKLNYVFYLLPGEEVIETYIKNVAIDNNIYNEDVLYGPHKMQNGTRVEGLTEGLMMMREGSQATMFFTSELGYGAQGKGQVAPYQSLKFEVELLEVIKDIETYEKNRMEAFVDTIAGADTIQNPSTDFYMYYVIDEPGDGYPIEDDTVVEIAYTGYLIDGRVFDERDADDPYEFTVGGGEVIMGWDFGIRRFVEGSKGRLIVPYQLGYTDVGSTNSSGLTLIPPYETLIFDIEVVATNPSASEKEEPEK